MEKLSFKGEGMYTMSLQSFFLKDIFIILCQYESDMTKI